MPDSERCSLSVAIGEGSAPSLAPTINYLEKAEGTIFAQCFPKPFSQAIPKEHGLKKD